MRNFFFLLILLLTLPIFGQVTIINATEVASLPEPVSNNAVVEGWANDTAYVYSFGGIDSTKVYSGIHLKSWRYNTVSDVWDTIPNLPDTLGKIAAGASWVDSIIYIIGGYHVYVNSNEASSAKVHRFDPRTNTYLSDGTDIPVPIDDHVQAVWNDSLIYVITGWSNTGNVPNVQIYDPANDVWYMGDPVPLSSLYMAFGASGTIIGNTIYYHGGARNSFNFPGSNRLRIGQINPSNPTQITWSEQATNHVSYRTACTSNNIGEPLWLGGSSVTYNYNGIAYNGSGGVSPRETNLILRGSLDTIDNTGSSLPMDLRGCARFTSPTPITAYLAGGMMDNQTVSQKTIKLEINTVLGIQDEKDVTFKYYPNPTKAFINLIFDKNAFRIISVIDLVGKKLITGTCSENTYNINVSELPSGVYFLHVNNEGIIQTKKIIKQ